MELIGSILDGRYRVESLIGKGGMGAVFRAVQEPLGREVALKVIHANASEAIVKRFKREARAVARLHHPGIAQVFDFGSTRDRILYIAMELIQGGSLASFRPNPPHYTDVMRVADQILAALAYTHARNVIHRDLKPENVLFTALSDGPRRIKLVDFGIAAVLDDDIVLTAHGRTVGTPIYMAPEQATAQQVGPPADIYALGVILYELFSGRPPFTGRKPLDVMYAKVRERAPLLQPRGELDLPNELIDIVMRTLRRNPSHRFELAADMRSAIRPFLQRSEAAASINVVSAEPGPPAGGYAMGAIPAAAPDVSDRRIFDVPMIGRVVERRRLSRLVARTRSGEGAIVVVEGTEGVGKTRLCEWLRTQVQEEGSLRAFRGGHTRGIEAAWEGMRSVLRSALHLRRDDPEQQRSSVRRFLRGHGGDDEQEVDGALSFIAGDGAALEAPREATFGLLERFLRRLASRRPLLIVLEDLEHAGLDCPSFIEHLVQSMRLSSFPLLLVVSFDPDRVRRNVEMDRSMRRLVRNDGAGLVRMRLDPLGEGEIRSLIGGLLPSGVTVDHIYARSRGNPLFALELAHFHRKRETAEGPPATDASWPIISGVLPQSLEETMAARIDQVLATHPEPELAKAVLEGAAVLDARFQTEDLERVFESDSGLPPAERLADALDSLIDEDLLVEVGPGGGETLEFSPVLLQDQILANMRSERRQGLHRHAAELYASAEAGATLLQRAHHLKEAGDIRSASQAFTAASAQLRASGRFREAAVAELRCAEVEERAGHRERALRRRLEAAILLTRVAEWDLARMVLADLAVCDLKVVRVLAKARLVGVYVSTGWGRQAREQVVDLPDPHKLDGLGLDPEEVIRVREELLLAVAGLATVFPDVGVTSAELVAARGVSEDPEILLEMAALAAQLANQEGSNVEAMGLARDVVRSAEEEPRRWARVRALTLLSASAEAPTWEQTLDEEVERVLELGLSGLAAPLSDALGCLRRRSGAAEEALLLHDVAIDNAARCGDGQLMRYRLRRILALRDLEQITAARGELIELLPLSKDSRALHFAARLALADLDLRSGRGQAAVRSLESLSQEVSAVGPDPEIVEILDQMVGYPRADAVRLARHLRRSLGH
jgi:hypothetical protein